MTDLKNSFNSQRKRLQLYAPLSITIFLSIAIYSISIFTDEWARGDAELVDNPNATNVTGNGKVTIGLWDMCSELNYGLGTRTDCNPTADELDRGPKALLMITCSLLFLSFLAVIIQMLVLLCNVFRVPRENLLRDHGILIACVLEIILLSLAIVCFALLFLMLRHDNKLIPEDVHETFYSTNEKLGYSFLTLFMELALVGLRAGISFSFGSLISTNRMFTNDHVYQPKSGRKTGEILF